MNKIKPVLTIVEHIVLIAALAGATGFYFGNSYGASHQPVKTAVAAPAASK